MGQNGTASLHMSTPQGLGIEAAIQMTTGEGGGRANTKYVLTHSYPKSEYLPKGEPPSVIIKYQLQINYYLSIAYRKFLLRSNVCGKYNN